MQQVYPGCSLKHKFSATCGGTSFSSGSSSIQTLQKLIIMHSMLDRRMMEVVVTIGAITVQISSSIVTIKKLTPVFYRPDALPMAQKTVPKCSTEIFIVCLVTGVFTCQQQWTTLFHSVNVEYNFCVCKSANYTDCMS